MSNDAENNIATYNGGSAVPNIEFNTGLFCVPADALNLLEIWQTHLGSCRESCDDGGKLLWDRIEAVRAQAQPAQHK